MASKARFDNKGFPKKNNIAQGICGMSTKK